MKKIIIESKEELNNLRSLKKGKYLVTLNENIDLKDFKLLPINLYNVDLIFDGNYHSIDNLEMRFQGKNNIGLFNTFGDSIVIIKNLSLRGSVEGSRNVGLIGGVFNGSIINSNIEGNVVGVDFIGGLVGISPQKLSIKNTNINISRPYCYLYNDYVKIGYVVSKANKLEIVNCEYKVTGTNLVKEYNKYNQEHHKKLVRHI